MKASKLWRQAPSPHKIAYIDRYASGASALDIGTGLGFYAEHLRKRGFSVAAIDLEPDSELTTGTAQASIVNLPFFERFDTVLAFDVLEHEPLEAKALRELRRVTGKRLILSVPNANDSQLHQYNLTYKHHIDKTHQREYFMDELVAKLEGAQFRMVEIKQEGPIHPAIFAEFFPNVLRAPVRYIIKGLFRLGILQNKSLLADIYAVVEPV